MKNKIGKRQAIQINVMFLFLAFHRIKIQLLFREYGTHILSTIASDNESDAPLLFESCSSFSTLAIEIQIPFHFYYTYIHICMHKDRQQQMWVFPKKKKHRGNDRISSRLSRAYWPSYHYYTAARCPACVVCHPLPSTNDDPLNSLWPLLDLNGSYMKRETYCCYSSVTTWVVRYYKDLKVVFVLKIGQISGLEQRSKSLEKVQYG